MKILLVDDDADLLDVLTYALRREGFNVITASDGNHALRRWEADQPDLVVLDVGLPRRNGFEVCRAIRQNSSTPVILLTGLTSEEHVLSGFRLGADDYVTKPFSAKQLAMRIRAVARRALNKSEQPSERELRVGELMLDVESHEVTWRDQTVRLTPIEFRLMYMLASNHGRVVSGSRLVEYIWGYDAMDVSPLRTHVCHIRKKLQFERGGPIDIRAVPGVGYRFVYEGAQVSSRSAVAAPPETNGADVPADPALPLLPLRI
jgi:DNA-binding response OmpR family regulator